MLVLPFVPATEFCVYLPPLALSSSLHGSVRIHPLLHKIHADILVNKKSSDPHGCHTESSGRSQ